jgi:membrane fusion protein (multidrug efflux system)
VIVRLDERDYRIALAQAQAQVAGAEANIENIDAQISVQQAQINADQSTGGASASGAGVRPAGGGALPASGADRLRQRSERPADYLAAESAAGRAWECGHIASVQPGSGTAFSLLPVQNAPGNYVKIVQRVPVKIIMDDPPASVMV